MEDAKVITPDMDVSGKDKATVQAWLKSGGEVTITSGTYENKGNALKLTNGTTLIIDGKVTITGSWLGIGATGETGEVAIKGKTDRSSDRLSLTGAYIQSDMKIEDVALDVKGAADNFILQWTEGGIDLIDAALSVANTGTGTAPNGMYVQGGATGFTSRNSDISFSDNDGPAASGIAANDEAPANLTFNITGGTFKVNGNGLNGVQGSYGKKLNFNFTGCAVEADGNGKDASGGKGDGFSYARVTLDGGSISASGNANNGLTSGSTGALGYTSLDATGCTITASDNGGYGILANSANDGEDTSTFENCIVEANGNGKDGIAYKSKGGAALSAAWKNSMVAANSNGGSGVLASGDLTVTGSSVEINENKCATSNQGALTIKGAAVVDATNTKFDVKGNAGIMSSGIFFGAYHRGSGIYVDEGASLDLQIGTVTGNSISDAEKPTNEAFGGGVYSLGSFTMHNGVRIYDNDAASKGDDIYSPAGAESTLILAKDMGEDLVLTNDGDAEASNDRAITRWFYDGANASYDVENGAFGEAGRTHRWERDVYAKVYNVRVNDTTQDEVAIKAAYGPRTTITPIDLTLYMGGAGYENVADAEGAQSGFPEPGYYITLPDTINNEIGASAEEYVDLTDEPGLTFGYTYFDGQGTERSWDIAHYAGGASRAEGGYAYTLKGEGAAEALKPTLFVTDAEGNSVPADKFDTTQAIYQDYTTSIGSVGADKPVEDEADSFVTASISYTTREGEPRDLDSTSTTGTGMLRVRGVNDLDEPGTLTEVASDTSSLTEGEPLAVMDEDATFFINEHSESETLEVPDANASLLFDNILAATDASGNEASGDEREGWLEEKAEQVAEETGAFEEADIDAPAFELKYLDLVDADNGNVYLTSDSPITVYWPYPEGTDKDTDFVLFHYTDLHREYTPENVEDAIMDSEVEQMDIKKLDDHIEFTTASFSPFALAWDADGKTDGGEPGSGQGDSSGTDAGGSKDDSSGLPKTGDTSTFTLAVATFAGIAAIGAGAYLGIKRKRS